MFYDPKKKKIQPWVIISFIVIPIILMCAFYILGKDYAAKKASEMKEEEVDIFDRF